MVIIEHRKNSAEALAGVPFSHGVEIDIRSSGGELRLAHDPFSEGEEFDFWLKGYRHSLLVLNVKEDGLEDKCLALLGQHNVTNFFFLDQATPTLVSRGLRADRSGACRVSDYEALSRSLAALCEWVWVDSFSRRSLEEIGVSALQSLGLKVCLVSPELHSLDRIDEARHLAREVGLSLSPPDAVCTKFPDVWVQN